MKKFFIFILLLFFSQKFQAQDKKELKPFFEFGYQDNIIILREFHNFNNVLSADLRNTFYGKMFFSVQYKNFSFYTSDKTYFIPIKIYSYDPKLSEFIIGGSYRWKSFCLNYEHMCAHSFRNNNINFGYDKVAIKINFYKNR